MGEIVNLIKIALIMMVPVICIAFIVCIIKTKKSFLLAKEDGDTLNPKFRLATVILSFLAVALWMSYMDIYRVVFTATGMPLIHIILFMIVNNLSASRVKDSKLLKVLTVMSFAVFIWFYILFPGGWYTMSTPMCLYGYVTDSEAIALLNDIASRMLQVSIIAMIAQTIVMIASKRKKMTETLCDAMGVELTNKEEKEETEEKDLSEDNEETTEESVLEDTSVN